MENLREIIRLILEKDEKIKSSGIVVVKDYGDEYKVLCLKRSDGSYDLTKGQSEEGESLFDTAVRETEEESGISDLRFEWGSGENVYCINTF